MASLDPTPGRAPVLVGDRPARGAAGPPARRPRTPKPTRRRGSSTTRSRPPRRTAAKAAPKPDDRSKPKAGSARGPRRDRLHAAERRQPDDRAGRADVPALRGAPRARTGERVAAPPGAEVLAGGVDPGADARNEQAAQGRPDQQGRDRGPRAAGQARTPPRRPAGRRPRLPAQAGPAPPAPRDDEPARPGRQGRAPGAGLVAVRHRPARGEGEARSREARPRSPRPRPEGDPRRDAGARRPTTRSPTGSRPAGAPRPRARARAGPPRRWRSNPLFADFQPSELRKADAPSATPPASSRPTTWPPPSPPRSRPATILAEELQGLDGRIAEADRDVAEAEFRRHEADQLKNRQAAAALGASSTRLGDAGVALQKDMIRAGAAMEAAEKSLAKTDAEPAAVDQTDALDILARVGRRPGPRRREAAGRTPDRAASRLIAELTEMHEARGSIRENTEAQAPRLAQKSRSAAIAVAGLAQKEGRPRRADRDLLALVEETEYGIALPTTLRVLAREMRRSRAGSRRPTPRPGPSRSNNGSRTTSSPCSRRSAASRRRPRRPPARRSHRTSANANAS